MENQKIFVFLIIVINIGDSDVRDAWSSPSSNAVCGRARTSTSRGGIQLAMKSEEGS